MQDDPINVYPVIHEVQLRTLPPLHVKQGELQD